MAVAGSGPECVKVCAGARNQGPARGWGGMHPVLKIIAQRLALGGFSLLAVSAVIFFSVSLLPGDYARNILGQSATPEAVANLRHELALDRPAPERYGRWLLRAMRGDFGTSFSGRGGGHGRAVSALVLPRLFNTLALAALAALVAIPAALLLGIAAAMARGRMADKIINTVALAFVAMPEFLIAYVLIYWLAVRAGLFPPLASVHEDMGWLQRLHRMALPALTLSFVVLAHILRMTRASLSELLGRPWMETALLKGLPRRRRIVHHALPNAWGPIVNIVAFNIAWLITGVVVTEVIFVYPGIGQLMVDAVRSRDIPVVQACALIFATVYIGLNLAADIIAIVTNPRLLHPK